MALQFGKMGLYHLTYNAKEDSMSRGFGLDIGFNMDDDKIKLDILNGRNYMVLLYGTAGSGVSNEVEFICHNLSTIVKSKEGTMFLIDGTGYDEIRYWVKNSGLSMPEYSTIYSLPITRTSDVRMSEIIRRFKEEVIGRYETLKHEDCKTWREYNKKSDSVMSPFVLFIHGVGGIAKTNEWAEMVKDLEVVFRIMRACGVMIFMNVSDAGVNTIQELSKYATSTICLRADKEVSLILIESELPSKIIEKFGFAYLYNRIEKSMFEFKTGSVKDGKIGYYKTQMVQEFIPSQL